MSRFGYAVVMLFAAELFTALFTAVAWISPYPRLLWNVSASVPIGLYRLQRTDHPALGDLVAIVPPSRLAKIMADRRYLPSGLPMLKHVAALPGQTVCRFGGAISVGRRRVATALPRDRRGRPLADWQGCHTVPAHTLFLLNGAPDSFDSRYFGALPTAGLIGRAVPLITRPAPGMPLAWHGIAAPMPLPSAR